eukprot:s4377_g4.t1
MSGESASSSKSIKEQREEMSKVREALEKNTEQMSLLLGSHSKLNAAVREMSSETKSLRWTVQELQEDADRHRKDTEIRLNEFTGAINNLGEKFEEVLEDLCEQRTAEGERAEAEAAAREHKEQERKQREKEARKKREQEKKAAAKHVAKKQAEREEAEAAEKETGLLCERGRLVRSLQFPRNQLPVEVERTDGVLAQAKMRDQWLESTKGKGKKEGEGKSKAKGSDEVIEINDDEEPTYQ